MDDLENRKRRNNLGPPKRSSDCPRQVIAKFQNWTIKEQILWAYRRSDRVLVGETRILIFKDFSVSITQKSKAFTPIYCYLHDHTIRFQLQYPAKLKVNDNSRTYVFHDPSEARRHFWLPDNGGPWLYHSRKTKVHSSKPNLLLFPSPCDP